MIEKLWMQTSEWEKMGKRQWKRMNATNGMKGQTIVCIVTIGVEVEVEVEVEMEVAMEMEMEYGHVLNKTCGVCVYVACARENPKCDNLIHSQVEIVYIVTN